LGIFDRLTRLARSEANHLLDSATEATQSVFGDRGSAGKSMGGDQAEPSPEDSAWPQEIREDYAALELPLGADHEAVKSAYRDLMRRYHPDRHAGDPSKADLANELTVRIRASYERLDAYLKRQA
jgi:DnaJ-class molecular chaperone